MRKGACPWLTSQRLYDYYSTMDGAGNACRVASVRCLSMRREASGGAPNAVTGKGSEISADKQAHSIYAMTAD